MEQDSIYINPETMNSQSDTLNPTIIQAIKVGVNVTRPGHNDVKNHGCFEQFSCILQNNHTTILHDIPTQSPYKLSNAKLPQNHYIRVGIYRMTKCSI